MKVLVTGGVDYIGSHTSIELLAAGHEVCIVDDLSNGKIEVIERINRLSNQSLSFIKLDIRDRTSLERTLSKLQPDAVIHFAGLKAVAESEEEPLRYYDVNVSGTTSLLNAMDSVGCSNIVFSSSATVYGRPDYLPYDEKHKTSPVSPYGRTKLMAENILSDWSNLDKKRRASVLRYFNPVGAHSSTLVGEDPNGKPNNLMPYITQVAVGKRNHLNVYGDDYETHDGTGIRDYIHVVDLAKAHVATIEKQHKLNPFEVINIGSGKGTTVLELVSAFELASGVKINLNITDRRNGDLAETWTNPDYAFNKLGWKAKLNINDMCRDSWAWQKNNPNGYI